MQPDHSSPSPAPAPIILSTREGYDRWASIYDSEGNPLIALEERAIAPLLGAVKNLSIADIGCGTGRHALRFAHEGAREVIALDFSEQMIAQGRTKPGAERIAFQQHDLAQPLPFSDGRFDRTICGLVVEHIADLELLYSEMVRVTKPSGSALITGMHPAMMLRGVQARFTDPESGHETRPAGHPHQLTDYINPALRAGLTITHLSEHRADEALAKITPRAERYIGWPMLFVMRLARSANSAKYQVVNSPNGEKSAHTSA